MAETRRYVIAKDRRFACLATNQKKILDALKYLNGNEDLYLYMDYKGEKKFMPLNQARLNKLSQTNSRILVFTLQNIENEENCVATFSIQETPLNVIVNPQGEHVHVLC